MPRRLRILVAAKLHANQLERHLELFEYLDEVEKVLVVRHAPLKPRLSKIQNVTFGEGGRAVSAYRMARHVDACLREQAIDLVVGFNPVPWGSIASWAARRRGVPTCLSLIGMDYQQIQKPWGLPFLSAVRHADAITVTGTRMTEGLARLGVERSRMFVLPHSVDTSRFVPGAGEQPYDIVSVGQLIHRKRMDVLLDAISLLSQQGLVLRLAVLGEGPLLGDLRAQAARLGILPQVNFLGYRDDVEAVLPLARVFCLASEWEGVPFAMMEAMACGLVPVVTDVGTIADWVKDGQNGRLVRPGDPVQLAEALNDVLGSDGSLSKLSARVQGERAALSFEKGAQVWAEVLRSCCIS